MEKDRAQQGELLQQLCTASQFDELKGFLNQHTQQDDFKGRMKVAQNLQELAENRWERNEVSYANWFWLASVHYLDFSPEEFSNQTSDEKRSVHELVVPMLVKLSDSLSRLGNHTAAVSAATLGLARLNCISALQTDNLAIELHVNRALAHGGQCDFQAAHEDANRALRLSPDHARAKRIEKNCCTAQKCQQNDRDYRWPGPLDTTLPRRELDCDSPVWNIMNIIIIILTVIGVYFARKWFIHIFDLDRPGIDIPDPTPDIEIENEDL